MTFGIYKQLHFLGNKNLGIDKAQLLYIKFHNDHKDNENRIKWINAITAEFILLDGVQNGTLSNHIPCANYFQGQFSPQGFPQD